MAGYLDTSALAKIYHQEIGSAFVEKLVDTDPPVFLSRLGSLELQSVLAGKIRTQVLTQADSDLAALRFRSDVRKRRFRIVAVRVRHCELAEALIGTYGASHGLRTLDALQLAVALDLHRNRLVDSLVTADKVLLKVAPLENLKSIDPEVQITSP